jgi:Ala-tRNA(Pro) deacylase
MKVAEFLKDRHVSFEMVSHQETFESQRMAEALHVSGHEVAKTVLLRTSGGFKYVVAVLPASKSIDFDSAARLLGEEKLELASEEEICKCCPDCEMGVLPPFGSQFEMETIMDKSLLEDEEIFFEGNTHHEAVRMKLKDYRHLEEPLVGSFAV